MSMYFTLQVHIENNNVALAAALCIELGNALKVCVNVYGKNLGCKYGLDSKKTKRYPVDKSYLEGGY